MPPKKTSKSGPKKAPKSGSKKPKKKSGGKKGKKGKRKPVDKNLIYCDDKHFDPALAVVTVEHCVRCPVFREMSGKIFAEICGAFPDRKFKLIQNDFDRLEPREGAFEVSISRNCRAPARVIWSGVGRGPPRREKFPVDLGGIVGEIERELNPDGNKAPLLKLLYLRCLCFLFLVPFGRLLPVPSWGFGSGGSRGGGPIPPGICLGLTWSRSLSLTSPSSLRAKHCTIPACFFCTELMTSLEPLALMSWSHLV